MGTGAARSCTTGLHDTGSTCQTSLCGAAGHFLLIMVPLGTVTLVEQPVLHLLAPHQPFPLDDRPALGTRRTLSSFSASSAFRVVPSRAPCPFVCLDGPYGRAMSVLCVCLQAGMQLAGTKRGKQDADSVGARRSAHRASTSSRARALSRQKHQDMR